MKQVYTSYFANIKNISNPISIARHFPPWYKGENLIVLAPSWELLTDFKNHNINKTVYTDRYIDELINRSLTPKQIIKMIPDNSTLLCWEYPNRFCHRHVLASILNNFSDDINVKEWTND